jgi:hypothetical protein
MRPCFFFLFLRKQQKEEGREGAKGNSGDSGEKMVIGPEKGDMRAIERCSMAFIFPFRVLLFFL